MKNTKEEFEKEMVSKLSKIDGKRVEDPNISKRMNLLIEEATKLGKYDTTNGVLCYQNAGVCSIYKTTDTEYQLTINTGAIDEPGELCFHNCGHISFINSLPYADTKLAADNETLYVIKCDNGELLYESMEEYDLTSNKKIKIIINTHKSFPKAGSIIDNNSHGYVKYIENGKFEISLEDDAKKSDDSDRNQWIDMVKKHMEKLGYQDVGVRNGHKLEYIIYCKDRQSNNIIYTIIKNKSIVVVDQYCNR